MSSAKRPRLAQSQPADDAAQPQSDQQLSSNHRHDTFRLGELPLELVFRVNDYLPIASSLSLAATCKGLGQLLDCKTGQALRELREFCKSLAYPQNRKAWLTPRIEFAEFLQRDAVSRAIRLEQSRENQTLRACSICARLHPRSAFSPAQLFTPPEARKCRGGEEKVFRLCQHTGLDWDFPSKLAPKGHRYVFCQSCGDGAFSNWSRLATRAGRWIRIDTYRNILKWEEGKIIFGNDIRNQLGQMRQYVCPHTVTSSDQFAGIEDIKFVPGSTRLTLSGFSEHCVYPGCQTSLHLFFRANRAVDLFVERSVGCMEDATDPEWLIQCGLL
ncbi:hypothetical protein IWX90DRAFT_413942 [Phyllosticta citrichinensis]|uniref:F-box domain-containing protein n=1 Tax=Phyllosticta citrichinensis TaxID=1130410 RepID=A0ABR1XW37_9PEZI